MNSGLLGYPLGRDDLGFDPLLDEDAYACVYAEQANGVEGGAATGSWTHQIQALTRVVSDESELVAKLLSSGGMLLGPGRYRSRHCALSTTVDNAVSFLYDVPRARVVAAGNMYAGTGGRLHSTTVLAEDEFVLTRDSEVQLRQATSGAQGGGWARGWAWGATSGLPEIHGWVELWKVRDR